MMFVEMNRASFAELADSPGIKALLNDKAEKLVQTMIELIEGAPGSGNIYRTRFYWSSRTDKARPWITREEMAAAIETARKSGIDRKALEHEMSTHEASAPGGPPRSWVEQAEALGQDPALLQGFDIREAAQDRDDLGQFTMASVIVTSTAPQSMYLEFGTSHMAERPFMRPALEAIGGEGEVG